MLDFNYYQNINYLPNYNKFNSKLLDTKAHSPDDLMIIIIIKMYDT